MNGLLTNKQKWRRQSSNARRGIHDFFYQQGGNESLSGVSTPRSQSEQSLSSINSAAHSYYTGKNWATTGDLPHSSQLSDAETPLGSVHNKIQKKKKLQFSPEVRVVLIPTVKQYQSALISDLIWWKSGDYQQFKSEALVELKAFLCARPELHPRDALREIYCTEQEEDLSAAVAVTSEAIAVVAVDSDDAAHVSSSSSSERSTTLSPNSVANSPSSRSSRYNADDKHATTTPTVAAAAMKPSGVATVHWNCDSCNSIESSHRQQQQQQWLSNNSAHRHTALSTL